MSHLQTNLNFLNSAINILLNRAAKIIQARSALQRPSTTKFCVTRPGLIFISICIWFGFPLLWLSMCGHYYYYCWTYFMCGYQKQKQKQQPDKYHPSKRSVMCRSIAMRRFHKIGAHISTHPHTYTTQRPA